MFSNKLRTLGLLIFTTVVSACGIFSDNKVLPAGERKSVLAGDSNFTAAAGAVSLSSLPEALSVPDWTQTGGTPHHVLNNIAASVDGQKIWTASFGKGASKRNLLLAQPVIFEDVVYAQDVHGTVSAFNLADGRKLWKQKLKPLTENEQENSSNGGGLAVDNHAVYVVTGFGGAFALDRQTGKILWRFDTNAPIRTAPTVCAEKLFIQGLDNTLLALRTTDGLLLWKYDISAEDTVLAGGSTPACLPEKNLLAAGFSNGELQAFNADIGYPLWNVLLIDNSQVSLSTDINAVKASPVMEKDTIYAVGNNNLLAAIDYRTGEIKWQQKIGSMLMPWLAGEYLFVLDNNHELSAMDKNSGRILWQTHLLEEYTLDERADIYLHAPLMLNSRLSVAASNGMVYTISPEDGSIVEKKNIGEGLPFAPVVGGNTLVFATNDAELIAFQ